MRRVGTPILGRPRPLPRQRRASHPYTLKCEEPIIGGLSPVVLNDGTETLPTYPCKDTGSPQITFRGAF
jgi:hypothetical protein